ncbi:MAG: FlgD immunoglobulin-like domain containing protein [Candidatus Zixiibacteriota bacterium]
MKQVPIHTGRPYVEPLQVDRGYSVRSIPDGGFLIAGTTSSYGRGKFDGVAIRTNPIGTVEWQRTFGGAASDYCYYSVTDNNAWVLIGHTYSYGAGASDIFLNKITASGATSVEDKPAESLPDVFTLEQNYPNPFNAGTTIEFTLTQRADVTLTIHNILGQTVREWTLGESSPGLHSVAWNGDDKYGHEAASGVYLYSLHAGPHRVTRKMVLLK